MYFTIYKITNLINGKIYIGSHKTQKLDDKYMGSGTYLLASQKKHGLENFKKEILFVFDNQEDMYAKEAELVNEEFLAEENTYNLNLGGFGGWHHANSTGKNLYGLNGKTPNVRDCLRRGLETQKEKRESDPTYLDSIKNKISSTLTDGYASGRILPSFLGKTHTIETRAIVGAKSKIHQLGTGNSQYGTMWIFHPDFGKKKIPADLIAEYVEQGWYKGWDFKRVPEKTARTTQPPLKPANHTVDTYREYYEIYSKVGFKEFVKITGYPYAQ